MRDSSPDTRPPLSLSHVAVRSTLREEPFGAPSGLEDPLVEEGGTEGEGGAPLTVSVEEGDEVICAGEGEAGDEATKERFLN